MAPPSALDKAKADRVALKDHLEFLETEVNRHNVLALNCHEVNMYLMELEETRKLLSPNHGALRLSLPATEDFDPYQQEYRRLAQLASRVYAGLHGIKMGFPVDATPSTSAAAAATHHHVKLPKLELPKFSGNLQEWVTFRDMFMNTVHNNRQLTNVEKLTQLKSLLTGEASRQVRSLILSDANYDIAWKALQERYQNNRELLFSLMKRLIFQPVVTIGTATAIRSMIDTTKECTRSLEVLGMPTDQWDAILVFVLFSKLDPVSRELWEQSLPDTKIPTLDKLYEFVEQRARALAASGGPAPTRQPFRQIPQNPPRIHHASATGNCKLGCSQPHQLYKCPVFQQQNPYQRGDTVKLYKLCRNCLMEGHIATSCQSKYNCKFCHNRHHTMLHPNNSTVVGRQVHHAQTPPPQQAVTPPAGSQPAAAVQSHHCSTAPIPTGVLATARINIFSSSSHAERRALVDGGSTNTQITRRTARQLNLPLSATNIPMSGTGDTFCGTARYITSFQFTPWFDNSVVQTAIALVVDKISGNIPSIHLARKDWPHLQGLQLADPEFDNPDEVEILLGTDHAWDILEDGRIKGFEGQPFGIKSTLGWLVAGPNHSAAATTASFHVSTADLDFNLRRFFEQEEPESATCYSSEEAACEAHFAATHSRDSAGRFTVKLPFKQPRIELGLSRQMAVRRFLSVESKYTNPKFITDANRLRQLQNQWQAYKEFMNEYEALGHMAVVPPGGVPPKNVYYIPHHAVFKESSTTTKLRVVFDASASTSNGTSLNDCLMVGPQLQDSIREIMLRFRLHPIAFTADIAKMFRNIGVALEDTDYQRILWRDDPSLPIKEYRLLTVTYGTGPAPYLAVKCLRQLAKDEQHRFPLAAKVVLNNFYVDDAASSCATLEEAKETVTQLIDLCMSGGMELRKWTTNSQELLQLIPEHLRETSSLIELQHDATIKTLGIFWDPIKDCYSFRLSLPPDMSGNNTKRNVLSQIAKVYDPLGWLAPVIIVCKLFMQELWKGKFGWDDSLPASLQHEWSRIRDSLQDIEKITIPRCIIPAAPLRMYLIGCSDASNKAISAVAYIACEYNGQPPTCRLLTSRTRVASVNPVTLPRLELSGCVLLSELLKATMESLHLQFDEVNAFTDSTIALHWVTSQPSRWKPYVRNRIHQIQRNAPTAKWFHIPGISNPADCASRGISGDELLNHPLWWNGSADFWKNCTTGGETARRERGDTAITAGGVTACSIQLLEEDILQLEAEAKAATHHVQPIQLPDFLTKFSSFYRLRRVMAFVHRFRHNCLTPSAHRLKGPLSVDELTMSRNFIALSLQKAYFPKERKLMIKGEGLPDNSKLKGLKPFLSANALHDRLPEYDMIACKRDPAAASDGLMRVGGRLSRAAISYDRQHPLLLPRSHQITENLIMDIHKRYFHTTASATLTVLQQQFWISDGLNAVKAIIRKCVLCSRHRANLMSQVMADLPTHRVNPSRPFSKVGIDYAGPFSIKPMVRSKATLKAWLAVFVCLTTKAIHIEVATSLSTDCFLKALRRFTSRRGNPSDIFSDCGTNFKGADKALREFFVVSRKSEIQNQCADQGIQWHFNPPGAPHFGGLWEAGVKSIKHHLIRVMGSTILTYEELLTLVTQIEGILNSRPLIPASADPTDLEVITPAHFLIGAPLTSPPEADHTATKESHLQRWQLIQQRRQLFWKRWSLEYLTRLQNRPKWMKVNPDLKVGQLVVIKEDRLPPLKWKLGRVLAVHPGTDGHVRVATLRTQDGETSRPVVKLSLLPID